MRGRIESSAATSLATWRPGRTDRQFGEDLLTPPSFLLLVRRASPDPAVPSRLFGTGLPTPPFRETEGLKATAAVLTRETFACTAYRGIPSTPL